MGNRALIQFKGKDGFGLKEVSPVVYMHYGGEDDKAKNLIKEVKRLMVGDHLREGQKRNGDLEYTCARFIGLAHVDDHKDMPDNNCSIGVWNWDTLLKEKDSNGDAGIFIVDVDTWEVTNIGGVDYE